MGIYFIVCPLVFLAGFVDSIAGGGGLISLPAYMFAGIPVHAAIATNKLSSSTGTVVSTARLIKNKKVDWGFVQEQSLAHSLVLSQAQILHSL